MKKIFTLAIAALMGAATMQAQTVTINKADGSSLKFNASEISSIEFNPDEVKADTALFHSFTGWLSVSSGYFTDSYYGDSAQIAVYRVTKGEDESYFATFHDGVWGDGKFDITISNGRITSSGKDSLTMIQHGHTGKYEATMSGPMAKVTISLPSVMRGTTITWTAGAAPQQYAYAGNYTAVDSVNVGGMFPYESSEAVTYKVSANADGTINLTVPAEQLNGTVMGTLYLGSYTINNIAWDSDKNAYFKDYQAKEGVSDTVRFSFVAVNAAGDTTINNTYVMDKEYCQVTVSRGEDGKLHIENMYKMGSMPFQIYATFEANKED